MIILGVILLLVGYLLLPKLTGVPLNVETYVSGEVGSAHCRRYPVLVGAVRQSQDRRQTLLVLMLTARFQDPHRARHFHFHRRFQIGQPARSLRLQKFGARESLLSRSSGFPDLLTHGGVTENC